MEDTAAIYNRTIETGIKTIFPNLFIIGAARSGTSSLHYYLSQHPDIFMSVIKEPHFFATIERGYEKKYHLSETDKFYHTRVVKDPEAYFSLFDTQKNHYLYKGESSPSYLYDAHSSKKIFAFNPEARIIIILREPCRRAISHYNLDYNMGQEKEHDCKKAVERDMRYPDKVWGRSHLYVELGFYFKQIKRYYDVFPPDQIYILKFEDLISHPQDAVSRIIQFLKLDAEPVQDFKFEIVNKTRNIKNRLFHFMLYTLKRSDLFKKITEKIPDTMRRVIKDQLYLYDDIEKKIDADTLNYLEEIFSTEKVLLKHHFGIEWRP